MKHVFTETKQIAEWDFPRVRTKRREGVTYDSSGWDTKCEPYVFRFHPTAVKASVDARWDSATGVLFVERRAWCGESDVTWLPSLPDETLERIPVRETMLRRVIELADDWYAQIACAVPYNPTDAELLADYSARQPQEQEAELAF